MPRAGSAVLKLRRGVVVAAEPLTVEVDGEERPAWADAALVGEVEPGDEVIVNTEALDLGLGSGGFDVVHVNLTRGLAAPGATGEHVMKLNYTSLQHPVEPVEVPYPEGSAGERSGARPPLLVIHLHGQLAPAAWAAGQAAAGLRVGYVQTAGGALPGTLSTAVRDLRERGLLAGHVTVAPCFGGEHEAISLVGAFDAAAERLGWDAVIAGPGPGILGSATRYGHGGMAALDSAHASLALGFPTFLAPRLSGADPRPRHRGVSHHTEAVLTLLLAPVGVAAPAGDESSVEAIRAACLDRHRLVEHPADLEGYAASGLPSTTMGRSLDDDPEFFAPALAGGGTLAAAAAAGDDR
jgi:hypothetical protein